MSDLTPPASSSPSPPSWEGEARWEMERELDRATDEIHQQMLDAKSDLANLAIKGREEEFKAALPEFLAMSFSSLEGDAFSWLSWDDAYYDDSLLDICVDHGRSEALKALLAAGVDPRGERPRMYEQIHRAAGSSAPGAARCVQALLEAGASANAADQSKDTPLMIAARRGNVEAMAVLLSRGANAELKNHAGQTAEDAARSGGRLDALGALIAWREARELRGAMAPELSAEASASGRPRI